MNHSNVEDKLAVNNYAVDKDVHITIQEDICHECSPPMVLETSAPKKTKDK